MSDAPQERSHTKNKESPETAKLRQADLLEVAPKLYSDLDSASPRSQSSEQPEQDDLYAQETSSSTFRGTGIPRATSSSPSGSTLPTSNDSHELDPAAGRVSSSPDLAGKSATAGSPVKANPKEISSVKEKILASGASKQELQRAVDNFTGDIEKRYGDTVNVAWKAWKIESKLWSFFFDEPYLKTEPSMTSIAPAPQTQQHNEDYKSCWRSMEAQLTAIKATYDNNVKELERIHKEEIEGVKSIQNMVLASMKEHYETQLESEKKKNKKGWGDTSLWAALFVLAGTLYNGSAIFQQTAAKTAESDKALDFKKVEADRRFLLDEKKWNATPTSHTMTSTTVSTVISTRDCCHYLPAPHLLNDKGLYWISHADCFEPTDYKTFPYNTNAATPAITAPPRRTI